MRFCRGLVACLSLLWRIACSESAVIGISKQGKRFAPVASYWPYRQFAISSAAAIARADFALTLAKKTPRFTGPIHRVRFGGVRHA